MEKLSRLLVALLSQTERGQIEWRSTADDKMFQFSMPDSTVCIAHSRGDSYYLSVMNNEGQIIDRFSDRDLDSFESSDQMERLYVLARRKALKAEETLDGILARLEARV